MPRLVKAVDEGTGWKDVPPPANPVSSRSFKRDTDPGDSRRLVAGGQRRRHRGRARIDGRDVAGKTGTAQVISLQGKERARGSDKDLRDHGWFVFMVPRDNPELAGVVFAEHSEHGYLAAPIAKARHRDLLRGERRPAVAVDDLPRCRPLRHRARGSRRVASTMPARRPARGGPGR